MKFNRETEKKFEYEAWGNYFEFLESMANKPKSKIENESFYDSIVSLGYISGYCKSLVFYNKGNIEFFGTIFFNLQLLHNAIREIINKRSKDGKPFLFRGFTPRDGEWKDFGTHINELLEMNLGKGKEK